MKKLLFVCTANVCRSPMAEAIFNALAEDAGLRYRASSAGVRALRGEDMTPNAREALEEIGIYAEHHSARQVSGALVGEADLTLVMNAEHVAELRRILGSPRAVHVLPEYAGGHTGSPGVPDPYGSTMTAYRASARQLVESIELLVGRLGIEDGPQHVGPFGKDSDAPGR